MTIEITRPEVEALIQRRLQSGAFADAEDVILEALRASEPLQPLNAGPLAAAQVSPNERVGGALGARIRELWQDMPEESRAKLPPDGASQVDHYVYGLPKREQ